MSVLRSRRGRELSNLNVFAGTDLRHRQRFYVAVLLYVEPSFANTPLSKSVRNFIMGPP